MVAKRMFLVERRVFSKSLEDQSPTQFLQLKYFWQSPWAVYMGKSHSHDICVAQQSIPQSLHHGLSSNLHLGIAPSCLVVTSTPPSRSCRCSRDERHCHCPGLPCLNSGPRGPRAVPCPRGEWESMIPSHCVRYCRRDPKAGLREADVFQNFPFFLQCGYLG